MTHRTIRDRVCGVLALCLGLAVIGAFILPAFYRPADGAHDRDDSGLITIRAGLIRELIAERNALKEAYEAEVYYSPNLSGPQSENLRFVGSSEMEWRCNDCGCSSLYHETEGGPLPCGCGGSTWQKTITILATTRAE